MCRKELKITITIIVAFICILSIYGQNSYKKFYHITRNSGLSQSTINCIIKDNTGYMWFGTNDGLNRYNGYTVQYFKHHANKPKSIGLGRVQSMFIDSKGRLWAGTDQGGLNLFNQDKENFSRFQFDKNKSKCIPCNDVRAIIENQKGELWIACYGGGLGIFNPTTYNFNSINLSDNNVSCLAYDDKGNLYAGTLSGVEIIRNGKNEFNNKERPEIIEKLKNLNVISIYKDSKGVMWFGTYSFGAFAFNPATNQWISYSTKAPIENRINHDIVRSFTEDSKGSLLIGTGGGGISIVSANNHVTSTIQNFLNNQYSLSSDIIYSFFRDEHNNLWIGTYNTGLDVVFDVKDKFNHIRSFGEPNSLSKNSVLSIVEDKGGMLWIGTDGGGLDMFDPIKNKFKHFVNDPNNPNSISGNVAKSLFFDRDGILWIGTFNAGLNAYNPKTGRFTRFYHDEKNPNSLASNHIWDIDQDKNGLIWMAMLNGGLDCYNPKTKKFIHYTHIAGDPSSLSDNNVSVIQIDSKGNLWIGTEFGGISVMKKGEHGKFKNFLRSDYPHGSLSSNQICSIYEDSKGQIWIGTLGGGINAYIEKEDQFKTINEDNGLPSNLVYAFLEDQQSNLWISTNNGLSKYIRKDNMLEKPVFLNYDLSDGLQSNEFSPQSSCITSKGIMYFGGINGINSFVPDSLKINTSIPPIVITDFKIFNKSAALDQNDSPLKNSVSFTKNIELNYSQSVITFEFASLDYVMPSKNKYKYKLEGFEENWNDVGNQRTATYTNLNPGSYVFKVIGSNNDGIWNEKGVSVDVVIKPPYYKTWIFKILVGIFILLIVYFFIKDRVKNLEKQKVKLKLMVNERTSELLALNQVLEKQNKEIANQKSELISQKENLVTINSELEIKQSQIKQQNIELENHRHNLEGLVNQRTAELENAKIKAEESDKLKMAFLSNMSHEIRTPMNAILGFSSLLNESEITDNEKQEFIRLINTNGNSLLVLIDDILDLSRIEANQLEIVKERFNLQQFLNDLYISYKQIKSTNNKVDFIFTSEIGPNKFIETDRQRLRQILTNLLDNAFKFTVQGRIEINLKEDSLSYIISVIDTGIGIDTSSISVIFDRFRKGDEKSARIYRGAGLGLTISKKLVELLNGKLDVTSEIGVGSNFSLTLPSLTKENILSSKSTIDSNQNSIEKIDLNGIKILIVEDEEDNYLYLFNLLKRRNTIIYWAKDGLESIEMNRTKMPDIILMDIKLPEMDGYESLKLIKKESPNTPVIAQTAFARIEEEKKIREAGFDDYIAKPIKPQILFKIIKKFTLKD